jgi:hypothetical protein
MPAAIAHCISAAACYYMCSDCLPTVNTRPQVEQAIAPGQPPAQAADAGLAEAQGALPQLGVMLDLVAKEKVAAEAANEAQAREVAALKREVDSKAAAFTQVGRRRGGRRQGAAGRGPGARARGPGAAVLAPGTGGA